MRTIRIVIIVPVSVRRPGIAPVQVIVITVAVAWIIEIIIIKITPHYPVMNFHTQVTIIIIICIALVPVIIIFFYAYIFVVLTLGRIIYIIWSLAGFVS